MNEDINLRIKFIQEVERHPYLYDHNHMLYNHRDKIEATWKKIGETFGESSDNCKKKWRLIRCSYTRSLKTQTKNKTGQGILAKGYYMAPHLRFLDPFLKSRSHLDDDDEESMENIEGNSLVQVTLDNVKVEREGDDDDYEDADIFDESSQGFIQKRINSDDHGGPGNKRMRQEENTRKDLSPNEMYLLSLAPFLEDMTERQKLTFQKGVVELIENIKYGS